MITTRPTTAKDLDLICQHRVAMFCDGGKRQPSELVTMEHSFRVWLEPRLNDGVYFGFIVENEQQPIAGVGLMELDWPPHPLHPEDGRRGYVLNMFVEPTFRKKGIARILLNLTDQEFKRRGIQYAVLHSTAAGRPIYEHIGWNPTSEMAKQLRPANRKLD